MKPARQLSTSVVQFTNTAAVVPPSGGTDPIPGDNDATDTDTLTPVNDVSVTSTTTATTALPGQTIRYIVTVRKAGYRIALD